MALVGIGHVGVPAWAAAQDHLRWCRGTCCAKGGGQGKGVRRCKGIWRGGVLPSRRLGPGEEARTADTMGLCCLAKLELSPIRLQPHPSLSFGGSSKCQCTAPALQPEPTFAAWSAHRLLCSLGPFLLHGLSMAQPCEWHHAHAWHQGLAAAHLAAARCATRSHA